MHDNPLNRNWTPFSLLAFALPTMAMMLFLGLYTIVDTIFVARFVNTDALSAINMVCPVINLTVGLGTMLATGGNAIISRKLGAGQNQEAREAFTLLFLAAAALGVLLLILGTLWIDRIIYALGASSVLFPYCKDYLGLLLLFLPANLIQTLFANLFVTAGKPGLGLSLSLLAGLLNILLDYVFMVPFGLGIRGAALGTGCGYLLTAIAGTVFFLRNRGMLFFVKPRWRRNILLESCLNGSSEMVSQLASALTTFLFNRTMMKLLGEDGVAAITILIYSQFLLNTVYIGFSMGVAPIIGFHYGKDDRLGQRKLFRICMGCLAGTSCLVFLLAFLGGSDLVRLFAPAASPVYQIAAEGFPIFSWSFLFCGLNIFASSMFTALSNGKVSAALSFLRTFGFLAGGILFLPRLFGLTGVWLAVPAAEGILFFISILCFLGYRKSYF